MKITQEEYDGLSEHDRQRILLLSKMLENRNDTDKKIIVEKR